MLSVEPSTAVVCSSVLSFNVTPLRICFGTQIRARADAFCLVAEKTSREPIAAELALLTKKPGKSRASREPRNVDAPDS